MNKAILIGNLTADPDIKTTPNGTTYANFSVACQRKFKNKETGAYDADFIRCVAWDKTAEFVGKYFQKGSRIALEGRIQTRSYEDKDGQKRRSTEVVADSVEFAGSKQDRGAASGAAPKPAARAERHEDVFGEDWTPDSSELPF